MTPASKELYTVRGVVLFCHFHLLTRSSRDMYSRPSNLGRPIPPRSCRRYVPVLPSNCLISHSRSRTSIRPARHDSHVHLVRRDLPSDEELWRWIPAEHGVCQVPPAGFGEWLVDTAHVCFLVQETTCLPRRVGRVSARAVLRQAAEAWRESRSPWIRHADFICIMSDIIRH